jgi:superfamily II RNA helicase
LVRFGIAECGFRIGRGAEFKSEIRIRQSQLGSRLPRFPTSANIIDIWPVIAEITKVLDVLVPIEHVDINATVMAEVRPNTRSTAQSPAQARAASDLLRGIGVPPRSEFKPDDFQLEALEAIEHEDVLVTAPTEAARHGSRAKRSDGCSIRTNEPGIRLP